MAEGDESASDSKNRLVDSWEASNLRAEKRAEDHAALCVRDVVCREAQLIENKSANSEHQRLLGEWNSGVASRHAESMDLARVELKVQERIASALEKLAARP